MNYAITAVADVQALGQPTYDNLFAVVQETSFATCRQSNDNTQMILKWPSGICPLDTAGLEHVDYSYEEILVEMAKNAWSGSSSSSSSSLSSSP